MAIGLKKIAGVAAVATVTMGLGLYGLSRNVVGQESQPTLVVAGAQAKDPFGAEPKVAQPPAKKGDTAKKAVDDPFGSGKAADPFAERRPAKKKTAADAVSSRENEKTNVRLAKGEASAGTKRRLERHALISSELDEVAVLEFVESPLSEVADYMTSAYRFPVLIDLAALDDIGLSSDVPCTISVSGISLRSALTILLDPLDLDYVVRDEVLMITSAEAAEHQMDPRVYSTNSLALDDEMLIEVIESMIAPDSWEEVGGNGRIKSLGKGGPGLVIAQTDQIHAQIADFLERLDRASK